MIYARITMKGTGKPLKRTPVQLVFDADGVRLDGRTDRSGVAAFDAEPGSGKVLVDGVPRYQGHLAGSLEIELWSLTERSSGDDEGAPAGGCCGSTAYPGMRTEVLKVNSDEVLTDSEGYLVDLSDWSEEFARARARAEGLTLTSEHWEVIRFLRSYYERHQVQTPARDIIKHFRKAWGRGKGSNRYLHDIFPRGGPQKQGNRLAGLLRTKGEH